VTHTTHQNLLTHLTYDPRPIVTAATGAKKLPATVV